MRCAGSCKYCRLDQSERREQQWVVAGFGFGRASAGRRFVCSPVPCWVWGFAFFAAGFVAGTAVALAGRIGRGGVFTGAAQLIIDLVAQRHPGRSCSRTGQKDGPDQNNQGHAHTEFEPGQGYGRRHFEVTLAQVSPQPQETGRDQQSQPSRQIERQKNKSTPPRTRCVCRQEHLPHAEQRYRRQ